ncbi:uncharacterized protein K02A2.6-like, partial [Actinia tenebrosa]|uniref:Uncharacterized protein K02A2.6-like n=1 Tax=Actinia tenebrosa TaxID=6105 RepID=A0A6P8HVN6_ACTTE
MVAPYHSYRDELSVYDGLVFRGERLLTPKSMRQTMKQQLHSSHIRVNACLRRVGECLFWPGMTSGIKQCISQCEACITYGAKQQRETLMSHEIAERPWEKIGADLFTIDGKDYLVMVDYFSNFWEIDHLPDTKASTIIRQMKRHFARQGIPDIVISDNGPQFSSDKFKAFTSAWGFDHCPGSPGHQQSNGKAEATVKEAKRLLKKAKETGGDLYLALLAHRNTPTVSMDSSPEQRLIGRRCQTQLPTTRQLLKPQTVRPKFVKRETKAKQLKQAKYYDRGARDLMPLEVGDV